MANTTESRDFYISSLDDDHNYRSIGDTSTVIGSGYMPSGSIMIGLVNSKNTTTYVYWHFDISAIPAGAEIESVSCGVKMSCTSNNNGARATAQLYAGTTAKGSSVTGNKGTSTSQKTITDAGTWTREELDSIMLKLWARWGTIYTKNCAIYFSGAVLTIQYTYNSEKFMLKTGGAWADAYRVLKKVNAEFGYRSATEIYRFIANAKKCAEGLAENDILDAAIVQKLLPKLHGSRKKLEPALKALWGLCMQNEHVAEAITRDNLEYAKFPEAADKIQRMMQTALDNGFTSFAEA